MSVPGVNSKYLNSYSLLSNGLKKAGLQLVATPSDFSPNSPGEILAWYEYINDVILDHLDENIKSTDRSGVWRYLISFKVINFAFLSVS